METSVSQKGASLWVYYHRNGVISRQESKRPTQFDLHRSANPLPNHDLLACWRDPAEGMEDALSRRGGVPRDAARMIER